MNSVNGQEHRIVLPEDHEEHWLLSEPPEYCIYCQYPFDMDLQLADPLHLAVPRLEDKLETLEGPAHLYCLYKVTGR